MKMIPKNLFKFPVDTLNKPDINTVVSALRVNIPPKPRRMRNIQGPEGRLDKLRKTVTALVKHERIELYSNRAEEARQYAERLISEAIRHGDCHKTTMEMADFWLLEKELVHKLFKVLVPRYESSHNAYTRMFRAPTLPTGDPYDRAVLELRGNPFPAIRPDQTINRQMIHNVLLDAAKYEYRQSKYKEMADKIGSEAVTAEKINVENTATPSPQ